jgi:hypothetical protein
MPENDRFRFDHARHRVATELQPEHIADFQRLIKTLRYGSRFQLLFAEFTEATYRDKLIQQLDLVFADLGQNVARIDLSRQNFTDFAALEAELRRLAVDHGAIHLIGVDGWFDAEHWRDFNIRREAIAFNVPVRLAVWLSTETMAQAIVLAPDLWAWRSGVYAFTTLPAGLHEAPQPQNGPIDPRTLSERSCRIAVLRQFLTTNPPPNDEIRGPLLDELAGLLASIGEYDEALRIRREEQLPAYERLGDVRARAITLGKIADVLLARGGVRRSAVHPSRRATASLQAVGRCVWERAVTLGKITNVLLARSKYDKVLLGKIADVLQVHGKYDEVLRIYWEEELPVYGRLGDVRARAVMLREIGGVLLARSEYDEALRICREGELPTYERPGDMLERVVMLGGKSPTCYKIAANTTKRYASAARSNCRCTSGWATCGRMRLHWGKSPMCTRRTVRSMRRCVSAVQNNYQSTSG